jgi:hypothetical protein
MTYTIKKIAPDFQEYCDPWVVLDANGKEVYCSQDKKGCEWYIDDMLNRKGHWFGEMIPHYFGNAWSPLKQGQPNFFPTKTAEQAYNKSVELYELERSMPRGAERLAIHDQAWDHYCIYRKELENYCLEETR